MSRALTPAEMSGYGTLLGGLLAGGAAAGMDLFSESKYKPSLSLEYLSTLAAPITAGAIIGAMPGMAVGLGQSLSSRNAAGKREVGFLRSMMSNTGKMLELSPAYKQRWDLARQTELKRKPVKKAYTSIGALDAAPDLFQKDYFNRVVWDDAAMGLTEPVNALKVTSAVNTASGGNAFVGPGQIASSLVNAGIGYLTAGAIGSTLGSLGMASPATQQYMRNIGAWSGVINGIGNAIR